MSDSASCTLDAWWKESPFGVSGSVLTLIGPSMSTSFIALDGEGDAVRL